MKNKIVFQREQLILTIQTHLLQKSMPRLQVSLIVLCTALGGFSFSYLLLRMELHAMWLRYPLAILFAYFVFLLLLSFWVFLHRPKQELQESNELDLASLDIPNLGYLDFKDLPKAFEGGGGSFGGGGASGSWGEASSSSSSSSFDLSGDEGIFVVIAVAALLGAAVAACYIIYIAPALLAEILVDGVLATSLYKKMKKNKQQNWLGTALRKTIWPAFFIMLFFTIAGLCIQQAYPNVLTLSDFWHEIYPQFKNLI